MISAAKPASRALAALLLAGLAGEAAAMSLAEALARARDHDPAVAQSLADYDAAREAAPQERSALLPSLSARATADYARTDSRFAFGDGKDTYPTYSAGVEARQPLFRYDWLARGDRAGARDTLAEVRLADRRQQLMLRVAERYIGVLQAQDQLRLAEAEAKAIRESLEDTRKRYEVELVPGTDLKEAQARDDLAQARLLSANSAMASAIDALAEVTGSRVEALPELPDEGPFPPLTPADAGHWVQAASAANPAVLAAQQELAVASADVTSRRSLALPALDVVASASYADSTEYANLGQEQTDTRVGLELNIPIYAGGINASLVREARARERSAQANLQRLVAETERSTRQLYRRVETGYFESTAYARSLASAQSAEVATRAGYDAGTRTISDVLDAKSRTVQARRDLANTRYQLLLNRLQLKQAAGQLDVRDLVEIDGLLQTPAARR